ncbi:MAG: DUF1289 domain-containing protein [Rhodocyclaceae bacterium]|nr:DUF1289 domain-containing protein [Rhodocyclaceae bacterium]
MSVESPCVGICQMNPDTGYCRGCLRTIDEIAVWSQADDALKQTIMKIVAGRRAQHGHGDDDMHATGER